MPGELQSSPAVAYVPLTILLPATTNASASPHLRLAQDICLAEDVKDAEIPSVSMRKTELVTVGGRVVRQTIIIVSHVQRIDNGQFLLPHGYSDSLEGFENIHGAVSLQPGEDLLLVKAVTPGRAVPSTGAAWSICSI